MIANINDFERYKGLYWHDSGLNKNGVLVYWENKQWYAKQYKESKILILTDIKDETKKCFVAPCHVIEVNF